MMFVKNPKAWEESSFNAFLWESCAKFLSHSLGKESTASAPLVILKESIPINDSYEKSVYVQKDFYFNSHL